MGTVLLRLECTLHASHGTRVLRVTLQCSQFSYPSSVLRQTSHTYEQKCGAFVPLELSLCAPRVFLRGRVRVQVRRDSDVDHQQNDGGQHGLDEYHCDVVRHFDVGRRPFFSASLIQDHLMQFQRLDHLRTHDNSEWRRGLRPGNSGGSSRRKTPLSVCGSLDVYTGVFEHD